MKNHDKILNKSNFKFKPKKEIKKFIIIKNKFTKIDNDNIIDEYIINTDFDFSKNNIQYSWKDEDYYILKKIKIKVYFNYILII